MLKGLKNLKWLTVALIDGQPQPILDSLSNTCPSLELFALVNDNPKLSYSSLNKLKRLNYLIIKDEIGSDTSLYALKGLKYLSVPDELLQDSSRMNPLKRALPTTLIKPNSGFCLGSGWLLVLLPLVFVWMIILKRFHPKLLSRNDS
jgi:hypothetical protein